MEDNIDDTLQPLGSQVEPADRPIVVVQYRRGLGSRLTIPILVVIAALAVLSHRAKWDDWRGLIGSFSGPAEPFADRPGALRPSVPLAVPSRALRFVRSPSGLATLVAPPKPLVRRPSPSNATHPAIALPQPGSETADALEEIRRVSAMARAEAQDIEALKDQARAETQRLSTAPRVEFRQPDVKETDESRQVFLADLRRALAQTDGRGAQFVEDLCRKRGVRLAADRSSPGTVSDPELTVGEVRHRVENLRARGFTEVAILEELVRFEARKRAARSGPKSRSEVIVRASRQLLAVQVPLRQTVTE